MEFVAVCMDAQYVARFTMAVNGTLRQTYVKPPQGMLKVSGIRVSKAVDYAYDSTNKMIMQYILDNKIIQ